MLCRWRVPLLDIRPAAFRRHHTLLTQHHRSANTAEGNNAVAIYNDVVGGSCEGTRTLEKRHTDEKEARGMGECSLLCM